MMWDENWVGGGQDLCPHDVIMKPMEQYTAVDLSHFVLKRILTKFH